MFQYTCLNPIADVGLNLFSADYAKVDDIKEADAALVRSASVHDMELGDKVVAIARAGAGVNNIPLDACAEKGIVVFNTPGANANGVKELVLAAMLYASRDLVGGIEWVQNNKDDANIAKTAEKEKKNFAGTEISGKKLGVIGLGAIGVTNNDLREEFRSCNAYARPECRDCWAKLYCSGGCAANAYHATGTIRGIYEPGCELFRKRIECAIMIKVAESFTNEEN